MGRIKFKYIVIAAAIIVMVILKYVFEITNLWIYVIVIALAVFITQYYRKKHSITRKLETIEEFNQLVKNNPDDPNSYFYRAQAYLTKFRTEEDSVMLAEKDLSRTIKLNPEHISAFKSRGYLHLSNSNHKKAISDFTKAIQLDPESVHAYYSRAVAYTQLKNYINALNDYEKVIEIDPDNAEAHRNKGHILFKLKKYSPAMDEWEQSIKLKPELETEIKPLIEGTKRKLNQL